MENPEIAVVMNKDSASADLNLDDSQQNIASTSRYGRARKPKSYFKDYYNTDEVVKSATAPKRGTKSTSPKMSPNSRKKQKPVDSDDFIHITGDADIFEEIPLEPVKAILPLTETTEDHFESFMKSVSGQVSDLKPESPIKERKFFKSTQDSKLQSSTISYISKVAPKQPVKQLEIAVIEPELDVNKVIKIVPKPTDIDDSQQQEKCSLKTYGNKRKPFQKADIFETFSLPDKPFIDPAINIANTSEIDAVIDTADKNLINIDNNKTALTPNTFFGVKLSPEKPGDVNLDTPVKKLPAKSLITSVTRIGKVQPTVTKIKSVLSTDSTKQIFATVSKQNIITIVPKSIINVENPQKSLTLSPIKAQIDIQTPLNIPTCKIKSISSIADPMNINNNNQEKKFVKVVMDKSKILKVLPTSGGSPIKLFEPANTSSESDKSDISIASPSFSPVGPKIAVIQKIPLPSVGDVTNSTVKATPFSSPTKLNDPLKSPRIIASTKLVKKDMIPISPIQMSTPVKTVSLTPKISPTGEVVGRKRKQELILRKDSDHSYSISTENRAMLPIPPKKKFIARMKTVAQAEIVSQPEIDPKLEDLSSKKEQEIIEIDDEKGLAVDEPKLNEEIVKESPKLNESKLSVESPKVLSFAELNISPVVRLKPLYIEESVHQLFKAVESTKPEIIVNKPLEAVSKNVVRVSPRKGKGTNAFLWETNSGAFFIKQIAKSKISEEKKDALIDNTVSLIKEEETELDEETSSPFKEKHHKDVDDAITKDIINKLKPKEGGKSRNQSTNSRQLRNRKFIFAEQIAATNRTTIAQVLDKTPRPSRDNILTRFGKSKRDTAAKTIDNLRKSKRSRTELTKDDDVKDNKRKSALKIEANTDVILVANKKKIIVINSDDEDDDDDDEDDLPLKKLASSINDSFVLKTEIKEEKVTPEKRNGKKRRGKVILRRSRRQVRKLRLINEDVTEENLPKSVKNKEEAVPLPIHSGISANVDLEVKEEKVDMRDGNLDRKKKLGVKKELIDKYNEGDMVWAKVGCHPYWPAMITKDPTKNSIKQTIIAKYSVPYYHVRYFADNGRRSWVRATALMHYKQRRDLDELLEATTKSGGSKKYKVPKTKFQLWSVAVEELESIKGHSLFDKLAFFIKASIRSAKRKKHASPRTKGVKREKPGEDTPSNISYKTLSSTRKIAVPIPELKTPTTSRQRLSSIDRSSKDSPRSHIDRFLQTQLEDKINWKKSRSRSSTIDIDNDLHGLKDFAVDSTDCSSSETDSTIHNKISLSGPIPCSIEYQELLHKRNNLFRKISRDKVCEICFKANNVLSCQGPCNGFYHLDCANGYLDDSSKISEIIGIKLATKSYKNTTLSRLRKSRGLGKVDLPSDTNSGNSSDTDSVNNKKSLRKDKKTPKNLVSTFICGSCDRNDHCLCFVCAKDVSPKGDRLITKCKVAKCGKAYHRDCTRLWPQVQWIDKSTDATDNNNVTSVICPRHVCHICVSDDPKAASARACRNEALVRCLICPATYHAVTGCVPAGTDIYTYSQIVCPRHLILPNTGHLSCSLSSTLDSTQVMTLSTSTPLQPDYYTKPLPPINTTWCFICSVGGDLVCCETCPTSVHEACSPINWMDDGNYICEDCETGRLILYDEVVWLKLGSYRWWPALVLYPKDVPPNVRNLRHRRGEFVIKFFGSYDHHWTGHGRVFLYQEGDKGTNYWSSKSLKRTNVAFIKAVEEAAKAFALKRDFKKILLQSESRQPKGLKPPAYIKIRCNKPVGSVKVYDGNLSITTPCSCDPKSESPCGPDTHCINRILWTECNPRNCPAGQRCQNQLFGTRQYPPLVPYRTDGRGWGLKTLVPIEMAQFVIEYVGEVIEEQEYKKRVANMQEQAEKNYYFLTIDSDRIIDAGPKGNVARFMNHSCDPNCETQKWTINGDTRVGLFACKDIAANSELTFNYNLEPNGKGLLACKCDAATCSGFIGVKKAADNPKVKISKLKLLSKRKMHLAKAAKQKNKSVLDKICFICGSGGKLISCTNISCTETYHIQCVHLMNVPHASWRCPRHYCNVCRRKIVKRCKLCVTSFCHQHCNIKNQGKIVEFVCADHKNSSKTANEDTNRSKDEVKVELATKKKVKSTKRKVKSKPVLKSRKKVSVKTNKTQRKRNQPKKPLNMTSKRSR